MRLSPGQPSHIRTIKHESFSFVLTPKRHSVWSSGGCCLVYSRVGDDLSLTWERLRPFGNLREEICSWLLELAIAGLPEVVGHGGVART